MITITRMDDLGPFTDDNGNINIGESTEVKISLGVDGNVKIDGNLSTTDYLTVAGNLTVNGDLRCLGDLRVDELRVSGDINVDGVITHKGEQT